MNGDSPARKRWGRPALSIGLGLGVVALVIATLLGSALLPPMLGRVDAKPAIEPLVPLGAQVSSAPVAFHRQCRYTVIFEGDSGLQDNNSEVLLSLNKLPEGNSVFLIVQTPRVTDESLPVLEQLTRVRRLVVGNSGISDAGIDYLKEALPGVDVWE